MVRVNSVTFSTDVTAGTFNVGSTTKSGVVILNGDTTVTNLNIYGGDANAEDSTVTINGDLDTTTTTLDDGTNSAVTKIIFADSDTVTISGAITAATANDGTIQVTGANKTFGGTIGGTRIGTLDIDETSTYTGAVTVNNLDIAASKTATFKNDVTLNTSATINSSATFLVASAGTPAAITVAGSVLGASDGVGTVQITNTGGTTFSGTVGNTANTLALINIDQDTTFSGSVEATDINNAASTTATFSDNVTATITNSGTLLFNATDAKSVTGTIAEAAGGDTTEVQVINSANGEAPSVVTFTGTVVADTLTVGSLSNGGAALFEEAVTVPTINITGGNNGGGEVNGENSTATFNKAVTATSGITLDDYTADAKVIFAANNSVTITGTIDGASSDEGTIQVTGATKTFASVIGGTQDLTLIDIDNTSTFNEAISATNINVADSITATAKKAITATAIVLDGGTLVLSDNNSVTIAGTINGSNTTEGTLQVTGATKTFASVIGGTQDLTLIDIDNTSTFNEAISATNINVADSITATAKKAITATAIVLDGGTLVLSDNNSVTIAGTINGSNTTEGTLQVTGATKTFSGAIGTTQALTLIDVDNAAIFNGSIEATTLSVAASNYAFRIKWCCKRDHQCRYFL